MLIFGQNDQKGVSKWDTLQVTFGDTKAISRQLQWAHCGIYMKLTSNSILDVYKPQNENRGLCNSRSGLWALILCYINWHYHKIVKFEACNTRKCGGWQQHDQVPPCNSCLWTGHARNRTWVARLAHQRSNQWATRSKAKPDMIKEINCKKAYVSNCIVDFLKWKSTTYYLDLNII